MIKIDYIVIFTDNDGLSTPLPEYILNVLSFCRTEAVERGCIFFDSENAVELERISTFIWDNQVVLDSFNEWAEQTHQYSYIYQQFIDFVELNGGTVERVVEEF